MSNDKLTQEKLDSRFVIDRQIEDLIGGAFEDFGMSGM